MSLYSSYSDEDLRAEIDDLKARIIAAAKTNNGVKVIAGEGRRVEFFSSGGTAGSVSNLQSLLRAAEAEQSKRDSSGTAIGVVF